MTSTNVSGISQTLPLLSAEMSNSSFQDEKRAGSPNSGVVTSTKEIKPVAVDTVSIASQTRQEEATRDDKKKEDATKVGKSEGSDKAAAKVLFVYDLRGELITKYMDNDDRIVYQVPTELSLRQAEMVSKSNSSVDMKA